MKNIVNKKNIILVASFVILAVVSFLAGTSYSKSKKTNLPNGFGQFGQIGQGRVIRGVQGGGMITGEILSKDDQSITVKNRDGGSKIIFYTTKTSISKMTDGIVDDLVVGKEVNIQGTINPDGSVSAQNISIRLVNVNKII